MSPPKNVSASASDGNGSGQVANQRATTSALSGSRAGVASATTERAHESGPVRCEQERREASERLADHDRRREAEVLDPAGRIQDERLRRHVRRRPFAAPVAPGLQCDHAVRTREPGRRGIPFARVAGEAVEEQRGRARAAVVGRPQVRAVALASCHLTSTCH